MSGIFCVFSASGIGQHARPYLSALRRLAHRGRDGEGTELRRDLFIGVRCASNGREKREEQPAVSGDRSIVAALDGRIFNREDLAHRLAAEGYRADVASDPALVLGAYAAYGERCFEKLDGVWALVLWDERNHRLLLGRDPIGVRPLYYYSAPRHLLVASEIKSIITFDADARAMDHRRVRDFVRDGWIDDWTGTCFSRIVPVPPGTVLEFNGAGMSTNRFWSLELPIGGTPAPDAVLDGLVRAVERHTPADVRVGVALSGGIDSSAIAGIVTRPALRATRRLHAFSITPPQTTDESFLIDATVRRTGIPHTYVSLDGVDHAGCLARLVDFHDEPIPYSGNFYQFELRRRMAEAGCEAALVGYGADEIFGGYQYLANPFLLDLVAHGRCLDALRFVRGAREFLGSSSARIVDQSLRYALGFAGAFLKRSLEGVTPSRHRSGAAHRPAEADVLALPDDLAEPHAPPDVLDRELRSVGRGQIFRRALLDCFRKNIALLVRIEDRNAAAHGLDLCTPFMDVALVRAALTLPAHRYMEGGWNKAVLRGATRDLLAPEVVGYRQKLPTPGSDTYVAFDALRSEFLELLTSESFHRSGLWSRRSEELYRLDASRQARGDLWFRVYMTHQWHERVVSARTRDALA